MTPIYRALRFRSVWIVFTALCVSLAGEAIAVQAARAGGVPPEVQVSFSSHSELHVGQAVSITVGANAYFSPYAEVNIVECADPGGLVSNLPIDSTTCDGNTAQGPSILVNKDGSFSEPNYPVYALPDLAIGDSTDSKPVCDLTNYCVLYVGQNTNDFSAPKVFSVPFLVIPGAGAPTATQVAGPSSDSSSAGTSPPSSTATSAPSTATLASTALGDPPAAAPGSLADTGAGGTMWLAALALALLLTGGLGRRLALRRSR
ncbi:MAG TPA: hypothetical protein VN886_20430 [Acidimicrobiales bacterium]|nr:hypothetical protein [Acidimicrobiales bacterium]